jgi:CRP-like cAMP-binding protein
MFFIIEGSVDILSSDDKKVVKRLMKNNYVGELAMLHQIKRVASVVANTFCLLYVLQKEDFDRIVMSNTELRDSLRKASSFKIDPRTTSNTPVNAPIVKMFSEGSMKVDAEQFVPQALTN